jgi:hypothetical protein
MVNEDGQDYEYVDWKELTRDVRTREDLEEEEEGEGELRETSEGGKRSCEEETDEEELGEFNVQPEVPLLTFFSHRF